MLVPLAAPLVLTAAPVVAPPRELPNVRVGSISQWLYYFHNTNGVLRSAALAYTVLELDIDLTIIEHQLKPNNRQPLHLPRAAILTLRGGDLLDEDDVRMEDLAEILDAVDPVEVRWLGGASDAGIGVTSTVHFVHPDIIKAGEKWSLPTGNLRKLVVHGGFPCCDVPEVQNMPGPPTFDFAFRTWAVEELLWQLDGFTASAAVTIVQHYVQAVNRSFPFTSGNARGLAARAVTFASVPYEALDRIRGLPAKLQLPESVAEWIQDVTFIGKGDSVSRLWGDDPPVDERLLARLRAELLVAQERRILPLTLLWA